MKRLCGQDGFNPSQVAARGARADGISMGFFFLKKKQEIIKNALKAFYGVFVLQRV